MQSPAPGGRLAGMGYRRLPFQFTLRQLFASTFWFCIALAVIGWLYRSLGVRQSGPQVFLIVLAPFIVCTAVGAAIGALQKRTTEFAVRSLSLMPAVCLVLIAIALVIAVAQSWYESR